MPINNAQCTSINSHLVQKSFLELHRINPILVDAGDITLHLQLWMHLFLVWRAP